MQTWLGYSVVMEDLCVLRVDTMVAGEFCSLIRHRESHAHVK